MVPVVVRDDDVRQVGALAVDPLEQGLDHAVAVDQDTTAAGPVDDEIGVRKPVGLFNALKDHGRAFLESVEGIN